MGRTEGKNEQPLLDRVLVATLITGVGAMTLAYLGEVFYRFPPAPFFPFVILSILIVTAGVSGSRRKRLYPNFLQDLKSEFSPSTGGKVEHAALFYAASVFLGLIGGLAGYLALRKRNTSMANLLLILGVVSTIVYADIIAGLAIKAPPPVPLPP